MNSEDAAWVDRAMGLRARQEGSGSDDADSDVVCGGADACAYDAENDADSDAVCGGVDSCAYDPENDDVQPANSRYVLHYLLLLVV